VSVPLMYQWQVRVSADAPDVFVNDAEGSTISLAVMMIIEVMTGP